MEEDKLNLPELPPGMHWEDLHSEDGKKYGWEDFKAGAGWDGTRSWALRVKEKDGAYSLRLAPRGAENFTTIIEGFVSAQDAVDAGVARAWLGAWEM